MHLHWKSFNGKNLHNTTEVTDALSEFVLRGMAVHAPGLYTHADNRPLSVHTFQTSSPPLRWWNWGKLSRGTSMYREQTFIRMVVVTWPRWLSCLYSWGKLYHFVFSDRAGTKRLSINGKWYSCYCQSTELISSVDRTATYACMAIDRLCRQHR